MFSNIKILTIFMFIQSNSINAFIHNVPTGFVGVKKSWGHITDQIFDSNSNPHMYNILTQSIIDIETRPQRDFISGIKCGTSEGLRIEFPEVAVYNQLPENQVVDIIRRFGFYYDILLIAEETRSTIIEMCSNYTLEELYNTKFSSLNEYIKEVLIKRLNEKNAGLIITAIHLEKPIIPENIQKNYDDKANEKTRLEAEKEKKIRKLEEADTERQVEEQMALKEKSVAEINHLKELAAARAQAEKLKIDAEAAATVLKTNADAEAYGIKKIASAERERHTEEYIRVNWQENVLKNARAYWGSSLPTYVAGDGVDPYVKNAFD